MPNGYNGKILHVDLTHSRLTVETPPESFYRMYMGGSAMGLYYILKDMPKGADALGPNNVLTVMTGVTTGAAISGQSRINVNAKSPISGGIGDSQGGGFFPAEFKFAGFDGLVIKGKATKPVYLWIKDGVFELKDAAHLAGKLTGEVESELKRELGDDKVEILQHGPAAEKGILFSSLLSMSNRNNGRTGMGLVMASKNLKAVVVRGTHKPTLADPKALTALNREGPKRMLDNGDVAGLAKYGTASVVMPQNSMGSLPTRNYNEASFEFAESISGEKMYDEYLLGAKTGKQDKQGRDTCYSCIVRCKRVVELDGKYAVDGQYGGPEYETIGTFGSYCAVTDLAAISLANQICNEHAVDTIACGATIAFAMECFEKGIISTEQTGGIKLNFGDADAMLDVLRQIVTASTPFGKLLGQGSQRVAEVWGNGADECLTTVKGAESPAHMPQAKRSLGLIYAVNPFGADHQSSEHDWMIEEGIASDLYMSRLAELGLEERLPPLSLGKAKVKFSYLTELFYSMLDSVELCQFVWGPAWNLYGPQDTANLVKAVTGWDTSVDELMKVGARRLNLMRTFNSREGLDRKDDKLPKKFFKALQGDGPSAGIALSHDEIEAALDEYYKLAGWTNNGVPTKTSLQQLGLGWAADLI
jgi:aldehyde:ferredoxin oxidoreductase